MPDLTLYLTQTCLQNVEFSMKVKSGNGKREYTVSLSRSNRGDFTSNDHCTCPAFGFSKPGRYGKTCKHLAVMDRERCHWNDSSSAGAMGEEVEGQEQRRCPDCKGEVFTMMVGA